MALSDKVVGSILLFLSVVIFVYYSIWVLVLPFVEKDHPVFAYFLPKEYAVAIPASLLFFVVLFVGIFIGIVLIKEARKKKS